MPRTKKSLLLPRARSLFASGLALNQIAEALGITAQTLRRWRGEDKARGADWTERRAELQAFDASRVIRQLEGELAAIAEDRSVNLAVRADIVSKLDKVIQNLRDRHLDVGVRMEVLAEIANWVATHFTEERRRVAMDLVDGYADFLKDRAGGTG